MTDNLDDFDNQDMGLEGQKPRGMMGNLGEAWRTKPMFKLMVIMIVVAATVAVTSSMFAGPKKTDATANVVRPPELREAPGGPVSPYMKKQTDLADQQRAEKALNGDGSALPTPQGSALDLDELAKKNDPLNELRTQTEKLRQQLVEVQQQQKQQQVIVPQQIPQEKQDDTLSYAMQAQLGRLMDNWKSSGFTVRSVSLSDTGVAAPNAQGALANAQQQMMTAAQNAAAAQSAAQQPVAKPKTLVPAGTVSYSQLLTAANSDVPGPIMVQIVSGPFSGGRAIGQFKVEEDYLVLQFNLVHFKGEDYTINAYALDPNTTLTGLATEVDHRYFTRVVLPSAAAFLQGLGEALGQTSQTVTSSDSATIVTQSDTGFNNGVYKGLGEAANTMGDFFQNEANRTKPLVAVAAGTPMGIFFVTTVFEKNDQLLQQPGTMPGYPMMNGYPVQGYPGTVLNGYGMTPQMPYGNNAMANNPYNTAPYNRGGTSYGTNGFYGNTGTGGQTINFTGR